MLLNTTTFHNKIQLINLSVFQTLTQQYPTGFIETQYQFVEKKHWRYIHIKDFLINLIYYITQVLIYIYTLYPLLNHFIIYYFYYISVKYIAYIYLSFSLN